LTYWSIPAPYILLCCKKVIAMLLYKLALSL